MSFFVLWIIAAQQHGHLTTLNVVIKVRKDRAQCLTVRFNFALGLGWKQTVQSDNWILASPVHLLWERNVITFKRDRYPCVWSILKVPRSLYRLHTKITTILLLKLIAADIFLYAPVKRCWETSSDANFFLRIWLKKIMCVFLLLHLVHLVIQTAWTRRLSHSRRRDFNSNSIAKFCANAKWRDRRVECPTKAGQSWQEQEEGIINITSLLFFMLYLRMCTEYARDVLQATWLTLTQILRAVSPSKSAPWHAK